MPADSALPSPPTAELADSPSPTEAEPPPPTTAAPPPLTVVLLDRCARFVDELHEIMKETGAVPLDQSIRSVLNDLPPPCRRRNAHQRERAIRAEILRHRAEVQAPAFAALRERRASGSRPAAAMRKEPVTFTSADANYYREVLDGIDPRLPQLTGDGGAAVEYLTIEISWPPGHHLRAHPHSGFISSRHDGLLVVYLGAGGLASPWCYLVLNTWANSVAVVPPLPDRRVASHRCIGAGVAVLRRNEYCDYALAELFLRLDGRRTRLGSNRATLFLWWSPGSGPLAQRWTEKEVVLPIPADEDTAAAPAPTYSFRADTVFALSTTALCWADLHTGILVCDHIDTAAAAAAAGDDEDDGLVFRFIPLPEECATKPDPLSWSADECRTMSCIDGETIVFVSMDGYTRGQTIDKAVLTTWTLKFPLTDDWRWEKDATSPLRVGDLIEKVPMVKHDDDRKLLPSCPVISINRQGHVVTHLRVAELEYKHEQWQWETVGLHELSIDMDERKVLQWSSRGSKVVGRWFSERFAVGICNSEQALEWESLQQRRSALKLPSPTQEEVVYEDEYWEWVIPEEVAS